jgi:hypothetical protein
LRHFALIVPSFASSRRRPPTTFPGTKKITNLWKREVIVPGMSFYVVRDEKHKETKAVQTEPRSRKKKERTK